ncbi:hypothetical protein [Aliiroseovarius sediminis]|uniref:hypothetical protein n=1 Tax=Aliiroseovarius sediminis TaxID=2925839 RepID=UPI001F590F99|nr:hypothetical protein [Aliiroseovarius sediminis]MCI2393331.1 hypothetical protein [Aliiroseovarius sediminis]
MNGNQIINMIIRQVMRRVINKGVNTGIDLASRRGRSDGDMTEDERSRSQTQADQGRNMAKRARKAGRLTRRLF